MLGSWRVVNWGVYIPLELLSDCFVLMPPVQLMFCLGPDMLTFTDLCYVLICIDKSWLDSIFIMQDGCPCFKCLGALGKPVLPYLHLIVCPGPPLLLHHLPTTSAPQLDHFLLKPSTIPTTLQLWLLLSPASQNCTSLPLRVYPPISYLFWHLCWPQRSSVMTHAWTSPGV